MRKFLLVDAAFLAATLLILSSTPWGGWGMEPGGDLKIGILLALYFLFAVLTFKSWKIQPVLAGLSLATAGGHYALIGWCALTSMRHQGKYQLIGALILCGLLAIYGLMLPRDSE